MPGGAGIAVLAVDEEGITLRSDSDAVLDVRFDGRRIWSFWSKRDGARRGRNSVVPWPRGLRQRLHGTTRVQVVVHGSAQPAYDREHRFGQSAERLEVVDEQGRPLAVDKSQKLVQTFENRSAEHVVPLLDAIEAVLAALGRAGVAAFPVYGTLLGAVREQRLIGHDSDADLGYVSRHCHPVDVVRESFRLQRSLVQEGYRTSRYSGAAFKVEVQEADGSVRGLDVFGGFFFDGRLHLMGELRAPLAPERLFPLGEVTLEGRTLPAPRDPEALLALTYGRSWRTPDPAFVFETPQSTQRRLNGWFRGLRARRAAWSSTLTETAADALVDQPRPTAFAGFVAEQEGDRLTRLVDVGCGHGRDALWFARRGVSVVGLDFVPQASAPAGRIAQRERLDVRFSPFNLLQLRSVLSEGCRIAHLEGTSSVMASHVVDAVDSTARSNLWRASEMMTRGGGRLYLQFLSGHTGDDAGALRRERLRPVPARLVIRELRRRGATVLSHQTATTTTARGAARSTSQIVACW